MAVKKTKAIEVYAVIKYWGSITLEADSLADALEQSKTLKVTDFIKPLGEHNDSAIKIVQVYDNNFEVEL